ncbi:MAG TPA: phage holin family protein [Burkholderiales bacterium]|nr:phage holin family protein [Burkholderiales bacterium]
MIDFLVVAAIAAEVIAAEKSPFDYSFFTYLWVIALSMFAGFTNFLRKLKTGKVRPFNIVEFIGELAGSALVGLITFWLCEESEVPRLYAAAAIAISGHAGGRLMYLLEKVLESWFKRRFSPPDAS